MNMMKKLSFSLVCLSAIAAPIAANAGSASLYVQDGLVACWDGIENAGANTHNPSATVWKDLVGGYEFTLTGVTVDDDRMTFAGSTSSYGTLSAADTTSTFVAAKNGTMEIVYVSRTIVSGQNFQVLLQSTASSGLAFGLYSSSSIIVHSASSADNKPMILFSSGTATNSVSVRFTSGGPVSAIANGESKTLSGGNYWGSPGTTTVVGKRASNASGFPGSIYCIRLYSRQLTDGEIAANHALDVKRFREGNRFDDSLEISGAPNGIGSPSPAYGQRTGLSAGDTIPVSCGATLATNDAGTVAYACSGWKLYDEDGNVVSNGAETSFAYVHPSPAACRRLEWQWTGYAIAPAVLLPSGYRQCDCIVVTNGNQYIDTGYKPKVTTDIQAHFRVPNFTSLNALYSAFISSGNYDAFSLMLPANADSANQIRVYRLSGGGSANLTTLDTPLANDIRFSTEYSGGGTVNTFTFNGETKNFAANLRNSLDYNLYLFRNNYGGTIDNTAVIGTKLYSFKMLEGGEVVRDFVPCLRESDSVAGLYDTVGKAFYANAATTGGSFGYEERPLDLLQILPIPDQVNETFDPVRPQFTVTNTFSGASWLVGGDIASPLFDVEYADNDGAGTATATAIGKGEYEGCVAIRSFTITATKYEDANISTTDLTARRHIVDGRSVYVFKDASSAKTVTAKRSIGLAECLLVGGGGGGGHTMAGGGGGGGVTNMAGIVGASISKGETFTLAVGAGGAGGASQTGRGGNGGVSSVEFGLFSASVPGGGGGGSWQNKAGAKGGSGGGGCADGAAGAGIVGYGFAGAAGAEANTSKSGGGGGAGHAGYAADTTALHAGYGGEGVSNNITGAWVVYGGGGGGGGSANGYSLYTAGLGGLGGGGDGSRSANGDSGADGFGGGGGGGGYTSQGGMPGGAGGSGTVILVIEASDFEIDPIPGQYMTAGACEPLPVVRDGDTLLVKDADYTVSYTGNARSGTALATVTGINGYAGKSATVGFRITSLFFAKPSVPSGGDGRSWASAMSVADAFAAAGAETGFREIWIQSGTVSQPAISIANSGTLTIRGGFAGTETMFDQRQPGGITTFDGEKTTSILLGIDNTTDGDVVLDRIKFCRAKSNGFVKTGKGGFQAYDCFIEANGRSVSEVYGRGMNVQSDGYGSLVVSNCVFAGNRSINGDKQWGGFGIYVKSFKNALIDNSLFVTNGYDLTIEPAKNYAGYLKARGSAILADDSPITVRNSRFSGNNCPVRKKDDTNWCGGTIALNGACGGSVIEHCSLIGNTEYVSAGSEGPDCGGAIAIRLNSASAKVAVRNCTIAYNITQSPYSSGGITVYRGDVDISNTILWKNLRYYLTTKGYGKDVHVVSGSKATIRDSLVTSLDGDDEALVGATVDAESVIAMDPRLVTTTAAFEALLTTTASAVYYTYTNPTIYEDLASMDAHLLSPAGYVVNGGAAGPATASTSPALDGGDRAADYANEPAPNGGRLNLGVYGNTADASLSVTGQPEAVVAVVFPGGEARPMAQVTMGLESGTGYLATVHVLCSTGGVTLAEETFTRVANGDVLKIRSPTYLSPGVNFDVAVTITAPDAQTANYNESAPVSGTYPPYYGKGGGPNVIHVRTGADGLMDGSNWENAYPDIRAAFASVPDETKTEMWLSVTNDYMQTAVTLAHPLTIRGGFTGTENSAAERPEGLQSTLDGINCNYETMEFSVPSGALLTVERIRFSHSSGPGVKKTGAGDLTVRDCYFTDRKQSDWNLQGGGIYASGGTVSITNCQFVHLIDYSVNALSYQWHGGDGIYLSSCTQAYVDDCLFATNGIQFYRNKGAQARHTGSAAYISATPTVFRNCRFASNGAAIMESADSAGIIHFKGASGGSKLINCALVGNSDLEGSQSASDPVCGGTIICNMSTAGATLDIENCTIAYNLTQGKWSGAGINVCKGTVNLKNSIVYGNYRNRDSDTVSAGADIEVKENGTLNMTYSLVTGLESNYIHAVEGGTLNIGIGVITNAPLMVSTTNDFHLLFADYNGQKYLPQSARGACAALDVHLRSPAGYMVDGQLFKYKNEMSPAIDAGDPTSDRSKEPTISGVGYPGPRVNLGAYGNTPEAAMTKFPGFYIYLR